MAGRVRGVKSHSMTFDILVDVLGQERTIRVEIIGSCLPPIDMEASARRFVESAMSFQWLRFSLHSIEYNVGPLGPWMFLRTTDKIYLHEIEQFSIPHKLVPESIVYLKNRGRYKDLYWVHLITEKESE